jgi:hypothetical protein
MKTLIRYTLELNTPDEGMGLWEMTRKEILAEIIKGDYLSDEKIIGKHYMVRINGVIRDVSKVEIFKNKKWKEI